MTIKWLSNSLRIIHWTAHAHEVHFQLDLCGGKIEYQDLLRYLSVAFQVGDNEANLLAEFYRHSQHAKESEEVFADELQLLARKVISKKPDFRVNLDTTLKQQYANQLYDCNSTSIAKTLLLQMPKVSFMQFRNELARDLGTHQHSTIASGKSISTSQLGSDLRRRELLLHPSSSGIRKLVPSTPRSKTYILNWMCSCQKYSNLGIAQSSCITDGLY